MKTRRTSGVATAVVLALVGSAAVIGAATVARTQDIGAAGSSSPVYPQISGLAGNWTGTVTLFGQPNRLTLAIGQEENGLSGTWSINDSSDQDFDLSVAQQAGQLQGTWSVSGSPAESFVGTVDPKGNIELTLDNPGTRHKHPGCKILAQGILSDDGSEIAGSFKSLPGCGKSTGRTGTFQITSRS
jgi:hypothetical protein